MDYSTPNSYKNFLPSKKIQLFLLLVVVVAALVVGVPKIYNRIASLRTKSATLPSLGIAAIGSGDPTTRDSDGDGVPDWEEILVGLDPYNPETTKGIPDAVTFEKIRSQTGVDTFSQAESQVSDTDKAALALYGDLSKNSIQEGQTTKGSVIAATSQEIQNYVDTAKAKNKTYDATSFSVVGDSPKEIEDYYHVMKKQNITVVNQEFMTHLNAFVQGTEPSGAYLDAKLAAMDTLISSSLAMQVPKTALSMHMAAVNALYGLRQTLASYDNPTSDPLKQFGAIQEANDYLNALDTANRDISVYFSLVMDPKTLK